MDRNSIGALRVLHLGKILSNFAILGAVLCIASLVSFLLLALYYLILIAVLLGTLFLILIAYPEFTNLFTGGEQLTQLLVTFSNTCVPIIAPITAVISALSIAVLAISKQRNVTVRIVFAVICLVVSLIFTVLYTFMGGIGQ